ncbi:hypothetical protein NEOLEDRAFT_1178422 [Neolentinus lepideus HHB14362 ss-1]|uniref:Peptide hydrolase n=1 Tax=Neolentinus lepideus HHB14362 ss-1 TaxID=1314782 RepID=A0A165SKJ6_9AGAM|nr:hypothetical protein NEOLEDRAFT_1178422 [Neolentinus lepideus HHB14362 ss-1]
MSTPPRRWGPVRSMLALSPLLIGAPLLAIRQHYLLPQPLTELYDPTTNEPQLSEARILSHAKFLSEDIGYRTVGTKEHALGDEWIVNQAKELDEICRKARSRNPERKIECEWWWQQGSGSHRFDMMNKRLYKTYVDLTNVVFRISDGTPAGKADAVLVNAHVDSTLPSPGAADDALPVGVMLECARVLIERDGWEPTHSIVFLFNNAEESLQDGSHLFSTQHPIANTVRAAINLEAAGTTGPELLFQATSEQMIEAYSHVPRPFGTIVANEVFSSGIILSEDNPTDGRDSTDFRQFEQYLNVTGLDMAIVGNSYLYHMRKDLVENIEPGVAQHMAENTLALLLYLSSPASPLPSLATGYVKPRTVFFSHLGAFFLYSYSTARVLYATLFVSSLLLAFQIKGGFRGVGQLAKGVGAVVGGFLGALMGANAVAVMMQRVLGKGMSWFAWEPACLGLYGPAALTGALLSQYLIGHVPEHTVITSTLLVQSFFALVLQLLGVGSAAMFFLTSAPLFVALVLDTLKITRTGDGVSLWTYALGQLLPLLTGTQTIATVLDVFVPLTGRIGRDAPSENIIASIVAITVSYTFPMVLPFVHRFGRRVSARVVLLLSIVMAASMATFAMRSPFDGLHQKRMFIIHMENVTSAEQHLHIAAADAAPGFDTLVHSMAETFDAHGMPPVSRKFSDWDSEWDVLYPFSAFLSPYVIDMPIDEEYASETSASAGKYVTISTTNDVVDEEQGTRSFTLVVKHPGIIWTAVAFDAHVLKWTLDENPPDEYARHHIKEASFYGIDTWSVDLVVKHPSPSGSEMIKVNFVGIKEQSMWPGKRAEKQFGGSAMRTFEAVDTWIEQETQGTVDALLVGCIGGVAVV